MCPGRYAKYYKSRYGDDEAFRAAVLARNQRYVNQKLQEDANSFRASRAEASRRSYDKKRAEIRQTIEAIVKSSVASLSAAKVPVAS